MSRFRSGLRPPSPLAAILLAGGVWACGVDLDPQKPPGAGGTTSGTAEAMRVRAAPVERGAISAFLETTATIESEGLIQVFPETVGLVLSVDVEQGDLVEKGQVLGQLDDEEAKLLERESAIAAQEADQRLAQIGVSIEEAQARVASLRTVADQARKEHERMVALSTPSDGGGPVVVSPKDLEAAKLEWDRAESDHALAKLTVRKFEADLAAARIASEKSKVAWELLKSRLEDTRIRAPIRGLVAQRHIKAGDTVKPGLTIRPDQPAFTITDATRLRVEMPRPQRELPLLRSGLPFVATTEALPGRTFHGKVARVAPLVDPASGNVRVTGEFDPGQEGLLPGMLVRVRVTTDQKEEAVLVPKKAVFYDGTQAAVFAVREGRAVRIAIERGHADRDRLEVLNVHEGGLRLDDRVVVAGGADLRDGAPVEVVDE